jgi:hypothetical protein
MSSALVDWHRDFGVDWATLVDRFADDVPDAPERHRRQGGSGRRYQSPPVGQAVSRVIPIITNDLSQGARLPNEPPVLDARLESTDRIASSAASNWTTAPVFYDTCGRCCWWSRVVAMLRSSVGETAAIRPAAIISVISSVVIRAQRVRLAKR